MVMIILIMRDKKYRQVLQYALLDELLVAGLVHAQEVKFGANAEEGWEREREEGEGGASRGSYVWYAKDAGGAG